MAFHTAILTLLDCNNLNGKDCVRNSWKSVGSSQFSQVNPCILIYITVHLISLIREVAALIKASLQKKHTNLLLSSIFHKNKKDLKAGSFNAPIDFLYLKY